MQGSRLSITLLMAIRGTASLCLCRGWVVHMSPGRQTGDCVVLTQSTRNRCQLVFPNAPRSPEARKKALIAGMSLILANLLFNKDKPWALGLQ